MTMRNTKKELIEYISKLKNGIDYLHNQNEENGKKFENLKEENEILQHYKDETEFCLEELLSGANLKIMLLKEDLSVATSQNDTAEKEWEKGYQEAIEFVGKEYWLEKNEELEYEIENLKHNIFVLNFDAGKKCFREQTRIGECEGCKGVCEECERLYISTFDI